MNNKPESKPVSFSKVVKTEIVLPVHTNAVGTVFGGTVMSWIDITAAIAALRHAGSPVVTASIDALSFIAPIYVGWIVVLKASVNYTAITSMEIGVRIDAENPLTGESFHTSSAYLTFVSLGSDGKPNKVPALITETDDEKRRFKDAKLRREFRKTIRHKTINNNIKNNKPCV